MPIKIPDGLPAVDSLAQENIFVMPQHRAATQDIRPLRIAILNLMPTKQATETQILRLLANTPLQVEVALLRTGTYQSQNTSQDYLDSFYRTFDEVKEEHYDGLVITGIGGANHHVRHGRLHAAVGIHHALGFAGGAAGVIDPHQVFGIDVHGGRPGRSSLHQCL